MADDKSKSGGQDRTRINVSKDYELRDWSRKFGVSPDELKAAVLVVGTSPSAVRGRPRRQEPVLSALHKGDAVGTAAYYASFECKHR